MGYNAASKARSIKYAAEHYKRVPLELRKADYQAIKMRADRAGQTMSGYIKQAINERMERDGTAAG